jgi:hypothetical protein
MSRTPKNVTPWSNEPEAPWRGREARALTKTEFYNGKWLAETEWWLNPEWLPELVWGRLRVFNDGTADACFAEGVTLYAFENRENAGRLLAQDDLSRFSDLGEAEEEEFGIRLAEIEPPTWADPAEQDFVYVGSSG